MLQFTAEQGGYEIADELAAKKSSGT